MSVLLNKRSESKAKYVTTAYEIYDETIKFLVRLSARYSRLVAPETANLAGDLIDCCEQANSIYPAGHHFEMKMEERTKYLITAKARLRALDVRLLTCYRQLMKNPKGAFDKSENVDVEGAIARIEHMADTLGKLIAKEEDILQGVIDSDSRRYQT